MSKKKHHKPKKEKKSVKDKLIEEMYEVDTSNPPASQTIKKMKIVVDGKPESKINSDSDTDALEESNEESRIMNHKSWEKENKNSEFNKEEGLRSTAEITNFELEEEGTTIQDQQGEYSDETEEIAFRPDQFESKTWLIVTIMVILLLIVGTLALGFAVFL